MAMLELEAMAPPSSSKYVGEEEQLVSKPSHNNPEEATKHLKAVTTLVDKFAKDIHGFNPCANWDAYQNFIHNLAQLLSKLDSSYFTNMNNQVVLDTILDRDCKAFLEHPEETVDKVQQCMSSDNIPTGPDIMNKMRLDKDVRTFDKAGQQAVTHLFDHLQDAHNHMPQVAAAVVELSKVSSPEQFTFVLKLAVRPIIQLKIPAHLSAPTDSHKKRQLKIIALIWYCHDHFIQNYLMSPLNIPQGVW